MLKENLLKEADEQAKQFQMIGPLKAHIDRLEVKLKDQVEELVYVKIENEELRQSLIEKSKETKQAESELEKAYLVSGSLQ